MGKIFLNAHVYAKQKINLTWPQSLINGIIKSTLNFILNWQSQKPHRKDLVLKKR